MPSATTDSALSTKDSKTMLDYAQALEILLETVQPLPPTEVPLADALGLVLAAPVSARWDLPPADNSAMDGYAFAHVGQKAGDTLHVSGFLPAGAVQNTALKPGEAVRIMTGAPLPPGADTVVPIEEVECAGDGIQLRKAPKVGEHVRLRGEEFRAGETLLAPGTAIHSGEIGLLAAAGVTRISVHPAPRVALLSTGDELVEAGTELSPETIVDSNSWALAAAVREAGAEPVLLGIARDNHDSLREKLRLGLTADALITSAGVSAGDRDLVREVLEELGVRPLFWKIDIKPGRPTAFGMAGKVPVFSLPGNPVSSLLTFDTFVRPALLKMLGHRQVLRPLLQATLQAPVAKKAGRVHFLRVRVGRVNGRLTAISAGDQNTGILSTLLHANGVAVLPAERESFAAGETIDIHLFEPELTPAEA